MGAALEDAAPEPRAHVGPVRDHPAESVRHPTVECAPCPI